MGNSWLDNPQCYMQPVVEVSISDISLQPAFKELYLENSYTDLQIIFKDGSQEISLNVHKIILILSSAYFKTMATFGTITNPLIINVEDALIAKKVIEGFYGIIPKNITTYEILMHMIIRDFFLLPINQKTLLNLHYEEQHYDLLFRLIDLFEPTDTIARILNRTFITDNKKDSRALLQKKGLDISTELSNLMIQQDLRYESVIWGDYAVMIWNSFQEKYLKLETKDDSNRILNVAASLDLSIILIVKTSPAHADTMNIIEVWSKDKGSLLKIFTYDCSTRGCICISPDHTKIIIQIRSNTFRIWDLEDLKSKDISMNFTTSYREHISTFLFTPDNKYFLVQSSDFIYLYDPHTFYFISKSQGI